MKTLQDLIDVYGEKRIIVAFFLIILLFIALSFYLGYKVGIQETLEYCKENYLPKFILPHY